jgi:hypothetical protein
MTLPNPSDSVFDADRLREAMSEIRASRDDLHAQILSVLTQVEQMGGELVARAANSEHDAVDEQTTRLAAVTAELIDFLADHKRSVAEERMSLAKEMRHMRIQLESLQKKPNESAPRQEGAKGRGSSGRMSPETSCP